MRPGDFVVLDNLGNHKGKTVRDAIERVFAKLKALLRRAAPRNFQALWKSIGTLLDKFQPPNVGTTSTTPDTARQPRWPRP